MGFPGLTSAVTKIFLEIADNLQCFLKNTNCKLVALLFFDKKSNWVLPRNLEKTIRLVQNQLIASKEKSQSNWSVSKCYWVKKSSRVGIPTSVYSHLLIIFGNSIFQPISQVWLNFIYLLFCSVHMTYIWISIDAVWP